MFVSRVGSNLCLSNRIRICKDKRKLNTWAYFLFMISLRIFEKRQQNIDFFEFTLCKKLCIGLKKCFGPCFFWFIDHLANKSSSKQKVRRLFIAGSGFFCFIMIYGSISFSVELSQTFYEIACFCLILQ